MLPPSALFTVDSFPLKEFVVFNVSQGQYYTKGGAYPSEAPLLGRLLTLPAIIRLARKGLPGTNALAYSENACNLQT